jgi:hypothetical protein
MVQYRMSVGANGLNILDFMARYETRNNGSKESVFMI